MSLLTRLWLSVLVAMLLALTTSFALSVLTARNYLAQQLYAQASDSAASLALSMSQQSKNAAMRELLVSALFDSGHFESITYRNIEGKVEVERKTGAPASTAPAWFVAMVPLDAAPGEAMVSDGWTQAGKVEVLASARYAYAELWSGTIKLAIVQGGIGVLLCIALALLMRWTQKPLRAIVEQAVAIGFRRFVMLPEPNVPELRVVGRAMNSMVGRVQAMFAEQAARIEQLRNDANRDALTRMPNRSLFMGSLREALHDEQAAPGGALVVARVLDLAGLNRRIGRERTDMMIQACASMLDEHVKKYDETATIARLNGAEFGILLPELDAQGALRVGEALLQEFERMYRQDYFDREQPAAIGWTLYRRGEDLGGAMLRLDACLMQAESVLPPLAGNAGETPHMAARSDDWRSRIEMALASRAFRLVFFPVVRVDGSTLHREAMLRMVDAEGALINAGQFMPAACRLGMTGQLDLLTLELAMTHLDEEAGDIAVNLSPLSLSDPAFLPGVQAILDNAGRRAPRLWAELSERGIAENGGLDELVDFAAVLSQHGCKLGIEHFGRHFAAMPRLHALSVDYLKLDGAFVAEIEQNEGNQRFVKAVVDVARSLDIQVIAERVASEDEWQALASLGVAGVTGPAVTARLG
ncbi:EAL domain-containing protein [Uliginosibacterium flavum]|uniref:EAL domain-containing protein n=1 Tax=Uliginosibacterium flavum TaxID=1396831 RepID=A0ABV2TIF4_9RHOO